MSTGAMTPQDEARIGQKNKITRRWTRRGTRPSAPCNQRTASTYIFGAICPAEGKGACLVLPRCTTQAMSLHLAEISAMVAPGAHAILVLDKAGCGEFENADDPMVLHPAFAPLAHEAARAPFVMAGPVLKRMRARLAARVKADLLVSNRRTA